MEPNYKCWNEGNHSKLIKESLESFRKKKPSGKIQRKLLKRTSMEILEEFLTRFFLENSGVNTWKMFRKECNSWRNTLKTIGESKIISNIGCRWNAWRKSRAFFFQEIFKKILKNAQLYAKSLRGNPRIICWEMLD